MYKQVIHNNKINLKDFFDVYPPLVKIFSEESNKFIKLFEEPKKRGVFSKQVNKEQKLSNSYHSSKSLPSIKESLDESVKNVSEISNKDLKDNERLNDTKKYFLLNKGLDLQEKKKKRTNSIKKSLQIFLNKSSVIGKLSENLKTIMNSNINNRTFEKKIEDKIKNKINDIVEKLSTILKIEKVPENKFVIKMNDIGDKCYFLLSGKLSIMKPIEYKNVQMRFSEYITYLINLMKYNEIDLVKKAIDINHIHINIETIKNLKIIAKEFFLRKIDNHLKAYRTLTQENFINLLDEYNLKFEDFDLNTELTLKDINNINNNSYNENSESSFDSLNDKEKTEKEVKNKYIIFKTYLNKFKLTLDEKITLVTYNFLFGPQEEKKICNFTVYKYEEFMKLYPGSFFGDMALDSKMKKRNASIRTDEECFILSLNNNDYVDLLYEDHRKLKNMDLLFLTSKFFFNDISPVIFEKYYFAKFKFYERHKDDIIFNQDSEFSSIYFIKKGKLKLEVNASVIDIHNLIKFFIDILEEKNYLNYSSKVIENLKETYLKDEELLELKSKNYLYKEKFNQKYKLEMSTINNYEILGDLELFLTSGYINTCTVVSQRAEYFEIKKRDLCDIFIDEKGILPCYYQFVMNKLISQIKRFFYLKNNIVNQIKSKISENFYQPLISPNFFDQIENNNTNTYFIQKKNLKKIMPPVFKYSHFNKPVIYDSKWKTKNMQQKKNEVYDFYQKEIVSKEKENENENDILNSDVNLNSNSINKSSNDIKKNDGINIKKEKEKEKSNNKDRKNILRNQRISKIIEEASTSKSLSNSDKKDNSNHKKNKKRNEKSNNNNNIIPFNLNNSTVIVGKYYLSLEKINKEINNIDNYDSDNLNIVKKFRIDKAIITSSLNNNINNNKNNIYLSSSSSTPNILPPIKIFKHRNLIHHMKKKENLSPKMNRIKSNFDISMEIEKKGLKNDYIRKGNFEISQAVKDFYIKQKKMGYSFIVNKNNNRYYKLGKKSFIQ